MSSPRLPDWDNRLNRIRARTLRYQMLLTIGDLDLRTKNHYELSVIDSLELLRRMEKSCQKVDSFNPKEFSLTAPQRSGSM